MLFGMIFDKKISMKKIVSIFMIICFSLLASAGHSIASVNTGHNINSVVKHPALYKITAPAPNPVENYVSVWYNMPENINAEIAIYNLAGVKIKYKSISGGINEAILDTTDLQSGVYFICLIYEGRNLDSKKIFKR